MAVWMDLGAARNLPKLRHLRALLLAKATEGGQAQWALQTDLERYASSAVLCMSTNAGAVRKVIRFDGGFPADVLEQLASATPTATRTSIDGHEVLHHGATWIAARPERVIVADSQEILARTIGDRLPPLELDRSMLLSARISPRANFGGIDRLLLGLAAHARDWHAITLSMTGDSQTSEVRFVGKSDQAARVLLETIRKAIDEVRQAVRPANRASIDRISVEATGNSVALRFGGPLDEFLEQLNVISAGSSRRGHAHGH